MGNALEICPVPKWIALFEEARAVVVNVGENIRNRYHPPAESSSEVFDVFVGLSVTSCPGYAERLIGS